MLQNELTNTESFSYSNRRDLSDAQNKVARELTDQVEQGCSVFDKLNAMSPQERVANCMVLQRKTAFSVVDVYNKPLEKPNRKAKIHHAWIDQELR